MNGIDFSQCRISWYETCQPCLLRGWVYRGIIMCNFIIFNIICIYIYIYIYIHFHTLYSGCAIFNIYLYKKNVMKWNLLRDPILEPTRTILQCPRWADWMSWKIGTSAPSSPKLRTGNELSFFLRQTSQGEGWRNNGLVGRKVVDHIRITMYIFYMIVIHFNVYTVFIYMLYSSGIWRWRNKILCPLHLLQ